MPLKSRAAILSIVIVSSVTVVTSAYSVDAQDASPVPSVVAEFSASLSAVQTQHQATALNLRYDFPNVYCKDRLET